MRNLLLATCCLALLIAPPASASPTDLDEDGWPDVVEAQACGRATVRGTIDGPSFPGDCASGSDYQGPGPIDLLLALPPEVVPLVVWEAGFVVSFVDADADRVPDALEPSICQVESQGSPTDGSCVGDDYVPPA